MEAYEPVIDLFLALCPLYFGNAYQQIVFLITIPL